MSLFVIDKTNCRRALLCIFATLVFGCSSSDKRYSIDEDIAPSKPISVDHIEDAQPQYEPYSLGGNKNYTLRGKSYRIVRDTEGYTEKGKASWYGKKFHGHLTSNGEIYDMYSMTAAHKTLPLPSYVKVTNLDNNKQTIVRVNDRGPFHDNRILDLSYAAATKLDVISSGTANIQIEVITVKRPAGDAANRHPQYVIQVIASPHKERVETLSKELANTLSVETFLDPINSNYRLMLGPFQDDKLTQDTLKRVKRIGYSSAFVKTHRVAR